MIEYRRIKPQTDAAMPLGRLQSKYNTRLPKRIAKVPSLPTDDFAILSKVTGLMENCCFLTAVYPRPRNSPWHPTKRSLWDKDMIIFGLGSLNLEKGDKLVSIYGRAHDHINGVFFRQ